MLTTVLARTVTLGCCMANLSTTGKIAATAFVSPSLSRQTNKGSGSRSGASLQNTLHRPHDPGARYGHMPYRNPIFLEEVLKKHLSSLRPSAWLTAFLIARLLGDIVLPWSATGQMKPIMFRKSEFKPQSWGFSPPCIWVMTASCINYPAFYHAAC